MSTFLIVGGLTEISSVSQIVEFLIALIGLGVAIGYSLLVVTRWREERALGAVNHDAVTRAMDHAGRAVVFSGLTVAIGLLSMIVLPVPMLRSVGYGGVLVPLVSVAVSITLLPVILATIGPVLDWPRLRTERRPSRVFAAWARLVYRRRWTAAVAGLAILTAMTLPALSLHLGEPGSTAQATAGPAHEALMTLTRGGVPSGVLTPAEILIKARPTATLGAGIMIDAVVVRCLLVPAMIALFGKANWWMPPALARVLRVEPAAATAGPAAGGPEAAGLGLPAGSAQAALDPGAASLARSFASRHSSL